MIEFTEQSIDTNRLLAAVGDPACGAQVLFVGTTRQWTKHQDHGLVETEFLNYEAYQEMALQQLQDLADKAKSRWPIQAVAIVHRLGKVLPIEASVAVAVSSPHRSEAFEAGQWLIDTLKHEVPIWKREHYVQSGAEWIHPTQGSCRCNTDSSTVPTQHSAAALGADENAVSRLPQP